MNAPSTSRVMERAPEKPILTKKQVDSPVSQASSSDSPASTSVSSPTTVSTNSPKEEARGIWIRKIIDEHDKLSQEELCKNIREAGFRGKSLVLFSLYVF